MESSHWGLGGVALLQGCRWRWGGRSSQHEQELGCQKWTKISQTSLHHTAKITNTLPSITPPHLLHLHCRPAPPAPSHTLEPCDSPSIHIVPSWVSSCAAPAHWGDRWGPACSGSGCPHSFCPRYGHVSRRLSPPLYCFSSMHSLLLCNPPLHSE